MCLALPSYFIREPGHHASLRVTFVSKSPRYSCSPSHPTPQDADRVERDLHDEILFFSRPYLRHRRGRCTANSNNIGKVPFEGLKHGDQGSLGLEGEIAAH